MINRINKTIAVAIVAILISSMAVALVPPATAYNSATQAAIDQGMNWAGQSNDASDIRLLLWDRWQDRIPTYVYVVPSPNPVGLGQDVSFVMFNPQVPNNALTENDIRYRYKLEITKPDGTVEHLPPPGASTGVYTQSIVDGAFSSDATGTAYTLYTVDQVGNYSIKIIFQELFYRWNSTSTERNYYGVTLLESSYTKVLVVQDEPVTKVGFSQVPLPTEFWSRPIEGQNTQWYQIASNWYNSARDRDNGGGSNAFQPDGVAPNSGHILWTRPTEDGGLIGGGNFSVPGEVYNAGHQYQTRFNENTIIMNGKLYYTGPRYWTGTGDVVRAVDLQTGQLLWEQNTTGVGTPSFGYLWDWDDQNQHGIVNPGWLFTNNFARAYHPLYGDITSLNITRVPSGYEVAGPKGESLRYELNSAGWLAQWNSSRVFKSDSSGDIIANVPITPEVPTTSAGSGRAWSWNGTGYATKPTAGPEFTVPSYDWNVSASWRVGMTGGSITIRSVDQTNGILLGSNGTHAVGTNAVNYHVPDEFTMWAVSIKPEDAGHLLWMKNIQTAGFPDNHVVQFRKAGDGVFTMIELPYQLPVAYSIFTGEKIWEADTPMAEYNPFGYYGYASLINVYYEKIAYGKYFVSGYAGMVFAYDLHNGSLLWRYTAPTHATVFSYYTLMMGVIADQKLYVGTHEHSADTPLFKGNRIRCLDVNTGEALWTMYGWAYPGTFQVADGILTYWNNYDHQIYAVGKGPSSMTVSAPDLAATLGSSISIKGTITDVSAGTNQKEQAARFPNGVPVVSDESQSQWMEYVYMQKERPTNTTGVPILLSVVDGNGNYREIGTTTSNDGFFTLNWKPDIEGPYTLYASFAGSESYWPSHAVTAFAVDPVATTPAPTQTATQSASDIYFVPAVAGIILAIAIGFAITILVLRKRP